MVVQDMEVVPRRDDEEWQSHFEEEQRRQNLQGQANIGTFLSVMALCMLHRVLALNNEVTAT
jgi:hypothetical protein